MTEPPPSDVLNSTTHQTESQIYTVVPALILLTAQSTPVQTGEVFSSEQAKKVIAAWQTPGRYQAADANPQSPYSVLQSSSGATWLYNYYKARQPGIKLSPAQNPAPQNAQQGKWDTWIARAFKEDIERTTAVATSLNEIEKGFFGPPMPELPRESAAPSDLVALAGDPPNFAEVTRQKRHTVTLDGSVIVLTDGPNVRSGYPFLRSTTGANNPGTPVTSSDLTGLARAAGVDATFTRVLQAVSSLEGGFDAVNTYDTGKVSVGFIQFACLESGSGSLGRLLQNYKQSQPGRYAEDFQRFGIDVNPYGTLAVLDPDTGKELIGPDAANKIVDDKRLTAVFVRAGKVSKAFQIEQLRSAQVLFDPRARRFTATINGQAQSLYVSDVVHSEVGLATVMDRLINTGGLGPLADAVTTVAAQIQAKSPFDVANAEDLLVAQLTYRKDFSAVANLQRPKINQEFVALRPKNSISGSLGGGMEPFPVFPGVNVEVLAQPGAPEFSKGQIPAAKGTKISKSADNNSGTKPNAAEASEKPTKPDENVGLPVTAVGG